MYVAPGYLFIWMVRNVTLWKNEKDNNLIFKSVIVSYLLVSIGNLLYKGNILTSIKAKVLLLLIALVAGYLIGTFLRSDELWSYLRKLKMSQPKGYFFNDIGDFKYGVWAIAHLPGDKVIYLGELRKYEENENSESTFIVLAKYIQYDYNGNEELNHSNEENCHIVLNAKNISRLELLYNENSLKIW